MASQSCTEEEFKKILKPLLDEKKKVIELQEKLKANHGEKNTKKKFGISAENEKGILKDQEIQSLKDNLAKVKPTIQKLVDELKKTNDELRDIKTTNSEKEKDFQRILQEKECQIDELKFYLEKNKSQEAPISSDELIELQNKIQAEEERSYKLEKENENLIEKIETLENQQYQKDEKAQLLSKQLDTERAKLVEKLAETLSQFQKQNELLQEYREEAVILKKEAEMLNEQKRRIEGEVEELKEELDILKKEFFHQRESSLEKEKSIDILKKALHETESKLLNHQGPFQETEIAKVRIEYEEMLTKQKETYQEELKLKISEQAKEYQESFQQEKHDLEEKFSFEILQKEKAHDMLLKSFEEKNREITDTLAQAQQNIDALKSELKQNEESIKQNLCEIENLKIDVQNKSLQNEEKEGEIKKAQQHLAKKIKESTLLRDVLERQKMQITQLHNTISNYKKEIEQMQNSLNIQRMHEEKLQAMAYERTQSAENLMKEWQEKYMSLYQEVQNAKIELVEFQRMKKNYEQISFAFSSLRNVLQNALSISLLPVEELLSFSGRELTKSFKPLEDEEEISEF